MLPALPARVRPATVAAALLLAAAPTLNAQATAAPAATAASPPVEPWVVVGRQGVMLHVIVPTALARDQPAYERQLPLLCEPERTCFINFYTNSTNAPLALPLPDVIEHEFTAVYRKSVKRASEGIRFSCRMQIDPGNCF